jgi:hypothetical protein
MESNLQDALFNITEHQTNSDDHYTPKWVFDLLEVEFDIDVASPPGGVAYIKAKKYYTQAEDGLIQPWSGLVWCNPPYSNIAPWIDRLNNHRNGIALLPHTKGSWRREIWNKADGIVEWNTLTEIRFLHKGKEKTIFPTTFLAAWGDVALQAIGRVGRVRT